MARSGSADRMLERPEAEDPVRDRILTAAFEAFKEHGFAQASTLEIATRARVSKRELYALFGSKQQMLTECISERAQRMRLPADWPRLRDRNDLHKALTEFGSVMLREITDADVIAVFRLAISEADRSPEVAQALEAHGRQAACAAVRGMLEQAQAAGALESSDARAMVGRFMSLLLGDVVLSLALGVAKQPTAREIRGRAHDAVEAFFRIYAAPGGSSA